MIVVFVQVIASDVDTGDMGTISYSILSVSNNGQGMFDIEPDSGILYVTQKVDRHETFIIQVKATDQAQPEWKQR
jgi:hypothetical protein